MDLIHGFCKMLNDIEGYHDSFIKPHERRTGKLMAILGKTIGLDSELCISPGEAGSIHDIGKISIPKDIIEKPGSLTESERQTIELHSEIGHKILKDLDHPFAELASLIALKGEAIPLAIRNGK